MTKRHTVIEIELTHELNVPQAMEASELISAALDAYIEKRTPALDYVRAQEPNLKQLTDHMVTERCNAVRWRNELATLFQRGLVSTRIVGEDE